ncbi:metalloreductase STEAP2 [Platysternon megacephalum]|uniref:Metalloreductase STEAP2 n=1 Tax=Platysternon megacephalum TaxID=55544 RepID=A0A4D9EC55_9SAUR|nr:metalloreductase STEAP2 [Platysternon megacephalum]
MDRTPGGITTRCGLTRAMESSGTLAVSQTLVTAWVVACDPPQRLRLLKTNSRQEVPNLRGWDFILVQEKMLLPVCSPGGTRPIPTLVHPLSQPSSSPPPKSGRALWISSSPAAPFLTRLLTTFVLLCGSTSPLC